MIFLYWNWIVIFILPSDRISSLENLKSICGLSSMIDKLIRLIFETCQILFSTFWGKLGTMYRFLLTLKYSTFCAGRGISTTSSAIKIHGRKSFIVDMEICVAVNHTYVHKIALKMSPCPTLRLQRWRDVFLKFQNESTKLRKTNLEGLSMENLNRQ